MISLEDIKLYIKLDSEEEDTWLEKTLIPAIELYFSNAGINITLVKDEPLYKLVVQMLACHWYENRGVIGNNKELTFGIKSLMTQLKFCYEEEGVQQ